MICTSTPDLCDTCLHHQHGECVATFHSHHIHVIVGDGCGAKVVQCDCYYGGE